MSFELTSAPSQATLRFLSQEQMCRYTAFPIEYDETARQLKVAMADINDFDLINDIQVCTGVSIVPVKSEEDKIVQWINAFAERARKYYCWRRW